MKFVPIKVTLVAKTITLVDEIEKVVNNTLHADNYKCPEQATDAEGIINFAAKRCYNSFQPGINPNVEKVRTDLAEYFDNILKSRHGSVLEHASYSFSIENITRVATAELNRHRAGVAVSEQSLRYCRFTDIPFWLPPSLENTSGDSEELKQQKLETVRLVGKHLQATEDLYKQLVDLWELDKDNVSFKYKKTITSMLRRILPMGICTGGVWTFNVRAMRHILEMRSSPHAEEEIAYIFGCIGKILHETEPRLFGDFKLVDGFWVPKYSKV